MSESWASSPAVRASMQGNRGRDTKPEMLVRRAAHALGLRYRVDIRPVQSVRARADLIFTRVKVAVFVDGCFWHGCPTHYRPSRQNTDFWSAKIAENMARDVRTTAAIEAAGWTVVRVWEHDDPRAFAQLLAERVKTLRACST